MIYSILSMLCIVLLLVITAFCLRSLSRKGGKDAVNFIRQFKKGNCVVVYLSAIPIYWIGYVYVGTHPILAFVSAVKNAVNLVGWKYDISVISALMNDNLLYAIAVGFCYVLAAFNTLLFIVSILHQNIWEWCQARAWEMSKREKLLLVGNNEENYRIYLSQRDINEAYKNLKCDKEKKSALKVKAAMIIDEFTDDKRIEYFAEKVNFISHKRGILGGKEKTFNKEHPLGEQSELEKYCSSVLKKCLKKHHRKCTIIVNMKDDAANVSLCRSLVECINDFLQENGEKESVVSMLDRIRIYVFGDPRYETIYDTITDFSKGSVHYINKYRRISMDFIDKYPLTQFMTGEHIDYETSLLPADLDVNVALIGFGKTNYQLFLTSVANNQFLTEIDGKMTLKPVHYYAFDNKHLKNDKNFNHSYNRFENEFKEEIEKQKNDPKNSAYLPLPDHPADVHYASVDINDEKFYGRIREILCGGKNKKFNYIVIAFGSDLENIDMAHKMVEKKQEWGLSDTYIFVKVRNNCHNYKIFSENKAFVIGNESETVYNINRIDDDIITAMAKMRNRIYDLEYEIEQAEKISFEAVSKINIENVYSNANYRWYVKKEEIERESNLYACLSLRSKLHLMGLDFCPKNEGNAEAMDNDTYLTHYAGADYPELRDDIFADDKPIVKYSLNFPESRRKTMAMHEHFRWNSYMLTKGVVPASKETILNDRADNGKNYTLRHHGNITTFEGLEEFRKMIAEREKKNEKNFDKIKYDYQLLDDAYWLLNNHGYKIVKREK